jgi:hypothetical protein
MAYVATFHVLKWRGVPGMVQALAFDRFRYARAAGLRLLRVFGTGSGSNTAPSTQLGRTAIFGLFESEEHADEFIARIRGRRGLQESWHVKLRGAGGHGSWRGVEIPRLMSDSAAQRVGEARSPVAIITRADVKLRSWRVFSRDARIVDAELQTSDGLLAVIGFGEAPILRLGTFSLWRDLDAMTSFARRAPQHDRVVSRTRRERWYGEEMFARFEPYWSTGSWDGRDPLRTRL